MVIRISRHVDTRNCVDEKSLRVLSNQGGGKAAAKRNYDKIILLTANVAATANDGQSSLFRFPSHSDIAATLIIGEKLVSSF